jgi:preprotein translocase subunit SecE
VDYRKTGEKVVANQSNSDDQERAANAVLEIEAEPVPGIEEDKQAKRRGRDARRRRRAERETAQLAAVGPDKDDGEIEVARKKDAPTPGRRQKERRGIIRRFTSPLVNYFRETAAELRKVTWPTRENAVRLSTIVIAVTATSALALGLYNYLLDIGLGALLELF